MLIFFKCFNCSSLYSHINIYSNDAEASMLILREILPLPQRKEHFSEPLPLSTSPQLYLSSNCPAGQCSQSADTGIFFAQIAIIKKLLCSSPSICYRSELFLFVSVKWLPFLTVRRKLNLWNKLKWTEACFLFAHIGTYSLPHLLWLWRALRFFLCLTHLA